MGLPISVSVDDNDTEGGTEDYASMPGGMSTSSTGRVPISLGVGEVAWKTGNGV